MCCSSWGRKESDTSERLNWIEVAWNVPLVSLIFLKRYLDLFILLFSSISLHWSLSKTFLSLLGVFWNLPSNGYIFLFLLFPFLVLLLRLNTLSVTMWQAFSLLPGLESNTLRWISVLFLQETHLIYNPWLSSTTLNLDIPSPVSEAEECVCVWGGALYFKISGLLGV